jgi:hypothetical protein
METKKVQPSSEQLLKMMTGSQYIKSLRPAEIYAMARIAMDPKSKEAIAIFEMLNEEKSRLDHIDKVFKKIIGDAMQDLDNGLMEIKKDAEKKKLIKAEAEDDRVHAK